MQVIIFWMQRLNYDLHLKGQYVESRFVLVIGVKLVLPDMYSNIDSPYSLSEISSDL